MRAVLRWLGDLAHRFGRTLDLPLLGALLALMVIGLLVLHSAGGMGLVKAQGARCVVGLAALWAISRIPILRIRVTAPTNDPITAIPATLANVQPWPEGSASRTRIKEITGMGMVSGIGNFQINGTAWDMDVINDTIILGSTEIWTWVNHSNMAHPMTVHGGSFYVLDRNGDLPPEWERGPKSVVHVDVGDTVRTIMKFATYTTGDWPLMYHCHNLMHIEEMMWQFVIVDPSTDVVEQASTEVVRVFPVPASSTTFVAGIERPSSMSAHVLPGSLSYRRIRLRKASRWGFSGLGSCVRGFRSTLPINRFVGPIKRVELPPFTA